MHIVSCTGRVSIMVCFLSSVTSSFLFWPVPIEVQLLLLIRSCSVLRCRLLAVVAATAVIALAVL